MRAMRLALLLAIASTGSAAAGDAKFSCRRDAAVRTISFIEVADTIGSCEVRYDKSSEGEGERVLWRAQNDPAFCQGKAEALAARLNEGGWACDRQETTASLMPEPMSVPARLSSMPASGVTAAIAPADRLEPEDMRPEARQAIPVPEMRPTLN